MAVIISTGLLSAGVLRKALLAAGYTETQFPALWLLVYGAFFTVPPLLVYVSLLLTWRDCVARVMEIVHPHARAPGTASRCTRRPAAPCAAPRPRAGPWR